jgi:uncharacterized membrane protein YhaH (DUF805 family)
MEWMLMPLKRYAEFSGRSRRMEYWMWVLFQFLIGMAFWVVMMVVGGGMMMSGGDPRTMMAAGGAVVIIMALFGLLWLAFLIPGIAVAVRRLHDTERTGWWVLAPLCGYVVMGIGAALIAASPDSPGLGGIVALIGWLMTIGLAITLIVFMFLEGTKGPNKYGPDPKGQVSEQVFT